MQMAGGRHVWQCPAVTAAVLSASKAAATP